LLLANSRTNGADEEDAIVDLTPGPENERFVSHLLLYLGEDVMKVKSNFPIPLPLEEDVVDHNFENRSVWYRHYYIPSSELSSTGRFNVLWQLFNWFPHIKTFEVVISPASPFWLEDLLSPLLFMWRDSLMQLRMWIRFNKTEWCSLFDDWVSNLVGMVYTDLKNLERLTIDIDAYVVTPPQWPNEKVSLYFGLSSDQLFCSIGEHSILVQQSPLCCSSIWWHSALRVQHSHTRLC